jgi:hypothetical protein
MKEGQLLSRTIKDSKQESKVGQHGVSARRALQIDPVADRIDKILDVVELSSESNIAKYGYTV